MIKYRHLKDEQALEGREVSMKTEQIKKAKRRIMNALADLRKLYNEPETSLKEMAEIADFVRVLDTTDWPKTIIE